MKQDKTKQIAMNGLMIALIFVCTYTIKVPNPATGGYSHMGDCMIFLSVILLGKRQGALAGGLGAGLSDLLSGATMWIVPTFLIKAMMGLLMGSVLEHYNEGRYTWFTGALLGGLWQCLAYTAIKIPLFNMAVAIASVPGILMQTLTGLIIYFVLAKALAQSKVIDLKGGSLI